MQAPAAPISPININSNIIIAFSPELSQISYLMKIHDARENHSVVRHVFMGSNVIRT
jgi:hypothetical protein